MIIFVLKTHRNSKLFFCKALKAPPIMHVVFVFVLLPTFLTTLANAWSEVDCLCTTQYDPVCGTDRRRYTNYCYFKCRTQYLKENYLTTIDKLSCYELSRYDRN